MEVGLSVIIPCYNEETRIPDFISSWNAFIADRGVELRNIFGSTELIFIDDGSKDQTFALLEHLKISLKSDFLSSISVFRLGINQGKGAAVKEGFLRSSGRWVLMSDLDLSAPLKEIFRLQPSKADVKIGSRALPESQITRAQSGSRPSLGRLFNRVMRMLTGIPILDTQCGFKLIRGDLARTIAAKMQESRFAFDVELLLLLNQNRAIFEEIAIEWAHRETSRVQVWRDGIQMVSSVVKMAVKYPRWSE